VELAARCQAEAILERGPGRDFAIVGHSSGAWLAHAAVAELERMGSKPKALVLLDAYHPGRDLIDQIIPKVTGLLHHATNDRGLLAMAGYMRMFKAWQPTEISTPTTVVRATDSLVEDVFDFESVSYLSWRLPHRSVGVRGNHFTMLQDYASNTAEAIRLVIDGETRGVPECAGRRRSGISASALWE
jgi:pimeloyl-ACP methyl ester carboxylesterase